MSKENDVIRFLNSYIEIAENIRRANLYNGDNSRKFLVLRSIRNFEKIHGRQTTISEISELTGMAMPNVSRFLRPLEESGYLERQRAGRTVYVHITDKGDQLLTTDFYKLCGYLNSMLDVLTEEETAVFLDCSEKISSALHNIIEQKNKTGDNKKDNNVQTLQKPKGQ